jgi:hypothetical protein
MLSSVLQTQAEPGLDGLLVVHKLLGEQPDLVVLVCIAMLVVSVLG